MNTKRLVIVTVVVALMLVLGLVIVEAGNGPGNGSGDPGGNGQGAGSQDGSQAGNQYGNGQPGDGLQNGAQAGNQYGNGQPGAGLQNGFQAGNQYGNGRGAAYQNGPQDANRYGFLNLPPKSADELPQDIIDLMIAGWTDEQHAYAVYGAVIDQFGAARPFTNIQAGEAQHIAAWENLFDRYAIPLPAVPGFDLPTVTTLSEACAVGADAETANAGLYDTMLAAFEAYPDLQWVAQSLSSASEFNHLPAFEQCASR